VYGSRLKSARAVIPIQRFGLFNAGEFPWIFHVVHEWMYVSGDHECQGIWLYNGNLGWLWTRSDLRGWFFSHSRQRFVFLYFDESTDTRFLWDSQLLAWESADP